MAPSRIFARGQQVVDASPLWITTTTVEETAPGYGVFSHDAVEPEDLTVLLRQMNEPELDRRHMMRIGPLIDRERRARTLAFAGGGGAVGVLVLAAAVGSDQAQAVAAVASLAGLVVMVWGGGSRPTAQEQT